MANVLVLIVAIVTTLLMLPIVAGVYTAAFYIATVALLIGAVVIYIKHFR